LEVEEVILFVNGAMKISVNRGAGKGEIEELKFVFSDNQGNSHVETKETDIKELGTEVFHFSSQGLGQIKGVSVYPVIQDKIGREFKVEIGDILEVPAGLVSWWRFDDLNDFVGENNCQLVGGIGVVNGVLDGSINCGNSASLDIEDKMAISFWIKTDATNGVILEKRGNYKVSLVERKVEFSFSDNTIKTTNEVNNSWNHVVVSVDADAVKKIYINEKLETFQGTYRLEISNDSLFIGEIQGEIDNVMIFNEPLAVGQPETLHAYQKK
jgi:hypothetical protein